VTFTGTRASSGASVSQVYSLSLVSGSSVSKIRMAGNAVTTPAARDFVAEALNDPGLTNSTGYTRPGRLVDNGSPTG
jgi:hypothetical protein